MVTERLGMLLLFVIQLSPQQCGDCLSPPRKRKGGLNVWHFSAALAAVGYAGGVRHDPSYPRTVTQDGLSFTSS